MTGFIWLVFGLVGGVVMATFTDLLSEEMRTRLDRLPLALIWVAVRRLPRHAREDVRREWIGELHEFLHGDQAVPVTRLVKGIWFAFGLIWASGKVASETPESDSTQPPEMPDRSSAELPPQKTSQSVGAAHEKVLITRPVRWLRENPPSRHTSERRAELHRRAAGPAFDPARAPSRQGGCSLVRELEDPPFGERPYDCLPSD